MQLSRSESSSLGGLRPEEVWLSEGDLLVLKGSGSSGSASGSDPEEVQWEPLDDYQAPYR